MTRKKKRMRAQLNAKSGQTHCSAHNMRLAPLEIVSAGLHWSFRMSRQMPPSDEMLGWNTLVVKRTLGGLNGSTDCRVRQQGYSAYYERLGDGGSTHSQWGTEL
jgi:hypothetical protein